jgi:DNA polymerase III alpha subunit
MDCLGDRGILLANMERILSFTSKSQGNAANGQIDLFGGQGIEMPPLKLEPAAKKITTREKLNWEKELLGIYISEHPISEYKEILLKNNVTPVAELTDEMNNQSVRIGGIITTVQKIQTRKGQTMYFCWFEDHTAKTELIVFPKAIEENPDIWVVGKAILVKGKVSTKDQAIKIIVDKALTLEGNMDVEDVMVLDPLINQSVQMDKEGILNIYIPRGTVTEALNDIKYKLAANKGETSVYVYVPNGPSGPKKVKLPFGIKYSDKLADSIRKRLHEN